MNKDEILKILADNRYDAVWMGEEKKIVTICPFHKPPPIEPLLEFYIDPETGEGKCWKRGCKKACGFEEFVKAADLKIERAHEWGQRVSHHAPEKREECKVFSEETMAKAYELLRDPKLMYRVVQAMERLKIAGERENGLLVYLTLTSRLLERPLAVISKGESSSGKSYLVERMLKLFPQSAYVDITDATPRSFFYVPDGHYKHKVVIVFEKHGVEQANYSIRTLQSEQKLKLQVTVKDKDTGEWTTKEKTVEGPIGFITTTTDPRIHPENETRCFSLYTDESEGQTGKVLEMVDARYRGMEEITTEELDVFQATQNLLTARPVIIPYVDAVRSAFPKTKVRVRRDYGQFLAGVEASAHLHQLQREKKVISGREHLIATFADYHIAQTITREMIMNTVFEVSPKTKQLIEASRNFQAPFTVHELATELGQKYDVANKWFTAGRNNGYFVEVEAHRGPHPAKYELAEVRVKEFEQQVLPPVSELVKRHPEIVKGETICDPLTGKEVQL